MAKILNQSSRTHVYSVDDKKAFALIGFDTLHQDSVITLIRETGEKIPRLLKQFGSFNDEDITKIQALQHKEEYWADDASMIIRIA